MVFTGNIEKNLDVLYILDPMEDRFLPWDTLSGWFQHASFLVCMPFFPLRQAKRLAGDSFSDLSCEPGLNLVIAGLCFVAAPEG